MPEPDKKPDPMNDEATGLAARYLDAWERHVELLSTRGLDKRDQDTPAE